MRMMPHATACAIVSVHCTCRWGARCKCQEMGTAGLIVGAKWTIPDLWRLSSMCFLLLNSFLFSSCSLGFYGGLPLCLFFLRVPSSLLQSALISTLDSAKYIHCKCPAHCPSRPPLPRNSVLHRRPCVMHISVMPNFWAWAQIDIPSVRVNCHS